jgi:hypothetical protein
MRQASASETAGLVSSVSTGWLSGRFAYRALDLRSDDALNPSQRAFMHVRSTTGFDVKHHSGRILGNIPTILFVDICGGVPTLLRGKLDDYFVSAYDTLISFMELKCSTTFFECKSECCCLVSRMQGKFMT